MNESFPRDCITHSPQPATLGGVLSHPEMQESLLLPGLLMQRDRGLVTRACVGQFLTGSGLGTVPIVALSQRTDSQGGTKGPGNQARVESALFGVL